nr:epsin-3 [Malus domestica]
MGTLFLNHIKKQASNFLQEKYKIARLTFTDVTPTELLAEEATNNDPYSPDAKTMTKIADASFDVDDYWRIVDILHRRLYSIDWKEWRQSYKALILLEFLLTHGPEDFAEEFQRDSYVIQELGSFKYIDNKGFNWGVSMQKKSDQILNLLGGGQILREARLKALKITNEIQGFGSATASPSSATSFSSSASEASRTSFGSFSTTSSVWNDINELSRSYEPSPTKLEAMERYSPSGLRSNDYDKASNFLETNENSEGSHLWDCPPIEEKGSLLESGDEGDAEDDDEDEFYEKAPDGNLISGMFSKLVNLSPRRSHGEKVGFRSVSDVGREGQKKFDRQSSFCEIRWKTEASGAVEEFLQLGFRAGGGNIAVVLVHGEEVELNGGFVKEFGIAESDDEFEDLGIDLRHPGVNASEASGAMEEFLKLGFGVAGKQLRSGAGTENNFLGFRMLGAGSDDRFEDLEIDLGPPSVNASEASGVRNFCNWDLEEGDAA